MNGNVEAENSETVVSRDAVVGTWRIVEMEVWDRDALNLVEPAHIEFEPDGMGSLVFIAVMAGIDYRLVSRDGQPAVEFSWEGVSEGDQISGRAWANIAGDEMRGHLFIHAGDDSPFTARRQVPA